MWPAMMMKSTPAALKFDTDTGIRCRAEVFIGSDSMCLTSWPRSCSIGTIVLSTASRSAPSRARIPMRLPFSSPFCSRYRTWSRRCRFSLA